MGGPGALRRRIWPFSGRIDTDDPSQLTAASAQGPIASTTCSAAISPSSSFTPVTRSPSRVSPVARPATTEAPFRSADLVRAIMKRYGSRSAMPSVYMPPKVSAATRGSIDWTSPGSTHRTS